jgi:hypothetical protein
MNHALKKRAFSYLPPNRPVTIGFRYSGGIHRELRGMGVGGGGWRIKRVKMKI